MNHTCRTCGVRFDCGYGNPCSSANEKIDCSLCLTDYEKMGKVAKLINKEIES
jgi:hypothetical protein